MFGRDKYPELTGKRRRKFLVCRFEQFVDAGENGFSLLEEVKCRGENVVELWKTLWKTGKTNTFFHVDRLSKGLWSQIIVEKPVGIVISRGF